MARTMETVPPIDGEKEPVTCDLVKNESAEAFGIALKPKNPQKKNLEQWRIVSSRVSITHL